MDPAHFSFPRATVVLCVAVALFIGVVIGFFTGFRFGMALPGDSSGGSAFAVAEAGDGRTKSGPAGHPDRPRRPLVVKNLSTPGAGGFAPEPTGVAPSDAPAPNFDKTGSAGAISSPTVERVETAPVVGPLSPQLLAASAPAVLGARQVGTISFSAKELVSDPLADRLYAASESDVVAINTASREVGDKFARARWGIHGLCLDAPTGKLFWLQNSNRGSDREDVASADLKTLAVTGTFALESRASALLTDGAGRLLVATFGKAPVVHLLNAIDGHEITRLYMPQFGRTAALAYSRVTSSAYRGDVKATPLSLSRIFVDGGRLNNADRVTVAGDYGMEVCLNHRGDALCYLTFTEAKTGTPAGAGRAQTLLSAADIHQPLGTFPATIPAGTGAFSPDDRMFFIASGKRIEGFSTETFARTHAFTTSVSIRALTFDRTGKFLFAATDDDIAVFAVPDARQTVAQAGSAR